MRSHLAGRNPTPAAADEPLFNSLMESCYRAANWQLLGLTTGRGKNDQTNKPNRPIKEILGLPLTARFREHLTQL